jgi:hypothetical protein
MYNPCKCVGVFLYECMALKDPLHVVDYYNFEYLITMALRELYQDTTRDVF